MATAYLSLGSNIEPERHLPAAIAALRKAFDHVAVSPIYSCPAVGFAGPPFWNAAARIETGMDAPALHAWLHALENRHARDRSGPRFSSRTLDIDLLLLGDQVLSGPGHLELPRPELATQAFVLRPMLDLAPDLVHPTRGVSLRQLYDKLADKGDLRRLDPADPAHTAQ